MKVWWGRVTPRAAQPPPQAACGRTPAPGPTGATKQVAAQRERRSLLNLEEVTTELHPSFQYGSNRKPAKKRRDV